jgi:DNA-binding transcriptional LysR family regulator
MDRLEAMAVLRAVVDRGSFTAAARALGMPLASASRKVAELEAHLGTRLLTRSTRRLALTDAGLAYADAARRILGDIEEAERAAAGEYQTPRGELVVTAPILFGRLHVLPIVTDFLALHPDINVRMLLSDRNLHLIEDHVDIGIRIGPLPVSDLVATRVGSMRMVTCAAPSLLAAHGTPDHPRQLADLPCVSFDMQAPATLWHFRDGVDGGPFTVPVAPRLSATTASTAMSAAVSGTGVTRLYHYQVVDAVRLGALEVILPAFEPEALPVHLIHATPRRMPLKTRVFLDFAAGRLRESLRAIHTEA